MSNIFAMVNMKSSSLYTDYAIKSFFKSTKLNYEDKFFLIDNDGCEIKQFEFYKKIEIIKNIKPLSFAENVNQAIKIAKKNRNNLIFLNNDIIFTKNWFLPLERNNTDITIPVCNQFFQYESDCKKLKLKITMKLEDFNENYDLLDQIVKKHQRKYKPDQKFQTLLMPFYCFKIPFEILNTVGSFDVSFGKGGAEDVDYRIRCALKNYEVYYQLDSYLLHFHGKSTWDGAESKQQTEKRNNIYTEVFLEKWKKDLTEIFIIRKNFSKIIDQNNLQEDYKKGKFGNLIRRLLK